MTLANSFSLLLIMITLAAVPSSSVALVVVRSATLGVRNGVAAALGIVVGDLIFVVLAIAGLVAVAETMGTFSPYCAMLRRPISSGSASASCVPARNQAGWGTRTVQAAWA